MKIICTEDFFGNKISRVIADSIHKNNNFLYLTATKSILNLRKNVEVLSTDLKNPNKCFSCTDFVKNISSKVRDEKNFLSNIDMLYILKKLLDDYFVNDNKSKTCYKNVCYDIFKLYKFLIFHNIKNINEEIFDYLKEQGMDSSYYVFDIYNKFVTIINDIIINTRNGLKRYSLNGIKLNIDATVKETYNTFIAKQKEKIKAEIEKIDVLYLDGFFSFDDISYYAISCAKELKKEVIFITKDITKEPSYKMIIEEVYNFNGNHSEHIDIVCLDDKKPTQKSQSIKYLGDNFNNSYPESSNLVNDNSIEIINPFLIREDELKFVAKKISKIIEEGNYQDEKAIRNIIENEMVIISAVDRDIMAKRLDDIFKNTGVFIFNSNTTLCDERKIDCSTFKKVYFSMENFIAQPVKHISGVALTLEEKIDLFRGIFNRIEVISEKKNLISDPIFEYVFQIYNIIRYGISYNRFRALLFSNWYYHTLKSKVKWDKYVGVLKQIRMYLKDNVPINDWITELHSIIKRKEKINDNENYKFHPFKSVNFEDIAFLINLLREIDVIVKRLSEIKGNFDVHISVLRNSVLSVDSILYLSSDELTDAQLNIRKFYNALKNIEVDSSVQNLEATFFAEHIKSLVSNIERRTKESDNIKLPILNMLNLKNYNHVFFIGLEADKYPRRHTKGFPFAKQIVDILKKIDVKSYELNIYKHNVEMERYFFKNVLDFATEHLYFTCTENVDKNKNEFCMYIKEIQTLFKGKLASISGYELNDELKSQSKIIPMPKMKTGIKKSYTIKQLCTYKLCPKLYYHLYVRPTPLAFINMYQLKMYTERVFFAETLDRFMKYNYENKKWYSINSNEPEKVINLLADEVLNDNAANFNCFDEQILQGCRNFAVDSIMNLINNNVINYLHYDPYTIVKADIKEYNCGNYSLITELDTAIYTTDKQKSKRASQNKLELDFLIFKSTSSDINIKHYNQMTNVLDNGNKLTDRIFLVNRMISKINIQFDSVRFINDGKNRCKGLLAEILNTNFSDIQPIASNFCRCCIVRDVCMGQQEFVKESDENAKQEYTRYQFN